MAGNGLSKYHPAWNNIDAEAWKLVDSFTVPDAAALLANIEPGAIAYDRLRQRLSSMHFTDDVRPERANALFQQLIKSIQSGELKAAMPETEPEFDAPF